MVQDERTFKIIGTAMEVHKELGCGFLEAVYQEALEREFKGPEIPFKSQPTIQIFYKGQPLNKTYQPGFLEKVYENALAHQLYPIQTPW